MRVDENSKDKYINRRISILIIILRIGAFGIFLGHGILALQIKEGWISLITAFGFSKDTAMQLLPIIGTIDVIVACIILLYPLKIVLIWAIFWGFATALSYPLAGYSIWEFMERAGNWAVPLALLLVYDFKKS